MLGIIGCIPLGSFSLFQQEALLADLLLVSGFQISESGRSYGARSLFDYNRYYQFAVVEESATCFKPTRYSYMQVTEFSVLEKIALFGKLSFNCLE